MKIPPGLQFVLHTHTIFAGSLYSSFHFIDDAASVWMEVPVNVHSTPKANRAKNTRKCIVEQVAYSHVCKWHASNAVLGPGCVESDKKIQKCLLPEPCKCIDIHVFLWNSKASKRMQWNWNVAHFLVPHFTFILHLSLYLLVPIPSWVVRFDGFEFNFSIYFKHWTANDAVCIQVRRSTERLHIWCKIDAECSRPSSESFLFLFFSENGVFRRYICLWSAMQRERTLNQIDCVVRNEFFLPLSLSLDAVHGTRLLCRRKHADESYSGAYRACDA